VTTIKALTFEVSDDRFFNLLCAEMPMYSVRLYRNPSDVSVAVFCICLFQSAFIQVHEAVAC